jgi:uncharacterized protein YegP (UPF0339 family)
MSGWYEVSKSISGQFRFVLKAANAETILTSELYSTRAAADKGIAAVQANSPLDERYEKKTTGMATLISTSRRPTTRSSAAARPFLL